MPFPELQLFLPFLHALQGRSTLPAPQQATSVAMGVRPAPLPAATSSRSRGAAGTGAASLWAPASSSTGATQQRGSALLLSSLGVPGAGASGSSDNTAPKQLAVHVDEEFGPAGKFWVDVVTIQRT